ncbi:uncharacterized protein LOC141587386 [Silene latifolia]|uniref:uncharacterized protein LOC141587386 n=1 Tax=Silene latifolia TaxID=37657 RepID=UPI003D776DAA
MAKKRHLIRSSIKSFFESHTDPAKHEKLKATRKGMEEKKNEILSIVQNEEAKEGSKRGPLAELIEDFHKQYESLYAHYDHLTGELKNKVHKHHKGKENSSSSSDSDSDSEHSNKENDNKNGKLDDENFRATDNLQQELEAAKLEVTLLRNKLEAACSEKEAIMSTLEGTERTLEGLKAETEILNSEKLNLLVEKEDLKSKVEDSFKAEVDLRQQITELIREKDHLSLEKEGSVRRIEEGNQNVDNLKAEVEQLRGDKQSLEVQLETINQDFSHLKQETENLNESMKAVEKENTTLSLKLSDITNEVLRARKTIEEFEEESTRWKEKLAVREMEFSSLKQIHDAHTTGTLEQIKTLEEENSSLKLKLDIVMGEKREIEEKFESKVTELREQISEVEILLKTREDQLSSLQEKLGITEKESKSQIEALATKVDVLTLETDELQAEKSKLDEQIKILQEGTTALEHELQTLQVHDREMKLELERKAEDIAEYLIQIQGLHEKLSSSDKSLKEYFHEKENLAAKLKDFELEVEKLETAKAGLEDETRINSDEATRLREEIQRLEEGTVELETVVQNKEEECATMQRKLEHQEIESSLEISAFKMEVDTLKVDLEAIRTIKSELEAQTEMRKQEYSETLKLLELQNIELQNKTEELKDALSQTKEQYEQLEGGLRESKADLEAAQSQIEKLTVISVSKDESTVELAGTIEDLKRDKEAAEDDAITALEKTHTIEVRLRLAIQKLRVTEQLLAEKEDDFKIAEKRYREERKLLENKIAANNKACHGMIMNLSKNMNSFVAEMEFINKKFEEDNEKFSRRIYSMSEELQILKHCMAGKNIEKEKLEEQLTNLSEKLQNEREHGLLMRQNLSKLEVQAENAKGEKKILESHYSELKSTVTILGDEKREAIRQLCLWSDDLHSRYNELKNIVAKSSLQRR